MLKQLHKKTVFDRRIQVLSRAIAARLPQGARVLDVGCGSGELALLIARLRPDVTIEGIDVLVRPDTAIPVRQYDGATIPFGDASFDAAIIVDVLHHTDDPAAVLGEVARVAQVVIVKDHLRDGMLAGATLRFMDYVGNAAHGVRLPYNYLKQSQWHAIWARLGLVPDRFATRLALYPPPFTWIFDRGLHFVTVLSRG